MPEEPITITREELHRQVWAEPMTKLAPKYGLSDVGLAKICRKYNIPRPPVGHWARLAHGYEVIPTPLPDLDEEDLNEIRIFRQNFFGSTGTTRSASDGSRPEVKVSERLASPCELVAKTRDALRSAKAGTDGLIAPDKGGCLCIRVAPKSVPRALRIFDAFIKAWEATGGVVTTRANGRGERKTEVAFGGDSAEIELFEEVNRIAKEGDRERHWMYRQWKYVPTGRLVLQVDGYGWGHRRRWADGKKQRVERILGSFLTGLRDLLEDRRLQRLDNECEQRQRAKLKAVSEERERRIEQEEQRRAALKESADDWQRARGLRAYLRALQSKIARGDLAPANPGQFEEWFDWASWYADSIDPLTPTPDRPEYVKQPENTEAAKLDATRKTRALIDALGVADTDELFSISREKVQEVVGRDSWSVWGEICRILGGLHYDVSDRKCSYW